MTGSTALWIFFVLITAAVIFETTACATGLKEGLQDDCSSRPNAWLASCLDISLNKIADYATANRVVQYLQTEVQDISGRYNVMWNLSPVIMSTVSPPPYTTVDQIQNFYSPSSSVRVNGQVPNLTLSINYPPPLKGPVGATGATGIPGKVGPTGPEGSLGPVGMSI
jgi:hypothetical protein